MIDYKFIKQLVESVGEVKDISDRSRKRYIVDLRSSYAKLCLVYINSFKLEGCGIEISREHSTIIHSLESFKNDYGTKHFKATEVYDFCHLKLKEIYSIMLENKIKSDFNNIDLIIKTYQDIKDNMINNINIEFETVK